jgi:hypothetical protein
MIEITDEMLIAWRDAMAAKAAELVSAGAPLGSSKEVARAGLAAVLAIVERDYDVRCGAVCPPELVQWPTARAAALLPTGHAKRTSTAWFGDDIAVSP